MTALIEERRPKLGDDLLSTLIRAEEAGDRLSPEELIVQAMGLLIAGFETTIGLIGNGVRALLLHPDELAKLRARPELIVSTVEECLRFDGPIPGTIRVLHEDAEFGGIAIPKNTQVNISIAAAHRDPRVFPEPDRFLIERDHSAHLAFGGGIHFCLGAHLARMEAQIAIGTLVRRFPKLELQSDKLEWGDSLFRIQARLPLISS
jgi:cytochrome P450